MKRLVFRGVLALAVVLGSVGTTAQIDSVADLLGHHELNLASDGRRFLVDEARRASFFLIGGLHGDNETPGLAQNLWPELQSDGYRYILTEMSPWAASHLAQKTDSAPILWGADIEEGHPELVIRDLAAANPQNSSLQAMVELTKASYRRSLAPQLLQLARQIGEVKDSSLTVVPLHALLLKTLEVEVDRSSRAAPLAASIRRETAMKELFVQQYRAVSQGPMKPKLIAVFGQNHLHRGYDRRGVSTLGNFIAELAVSEGVQSFHLALFAAGGKVSVEGLQEADQRKDEPAFELLAGIARYPATIFDLRPVRQALRQGSAGTLSQRDANLLYWADTYDAILCYREVTPAGRPSPTH